MISVHQNKLYRILDERILGHNEKEVIFVVSQELPSYSVRELLSELRLINVNHNMPELCSADITLPGYYRVTSLCKHTTSRYFGANPDFGSMPYSNSGFTYYGKRHSSALLKKYTHLDIVNGFSAKVKLSGVTYD